jgi:tetratricopeptide (TPR) repeat protein
MFVPFIVAFFKQPEARMPFHHPIIDLLDSLNKGQVRFVRSRLPNKQLRLFDFLTAKKNLESKEKIQKGIGTTAFGLLALLSELEKAVVTLVGEYAQRKRPTAPIMQWISLGNGYLELGDLPKAMRAFEQAQAEAVAAGDHALALQVTHLLKAYLPLGQVEAVDDGLASADTLAETLRLLALGGQLHKVKRLPFPDRVSAVSAILSALAQPPSDRGNLIVHSSIQIRCLALLERYEEVVAQYELLAAAINSDMRILYNPTVLSFSVSACILASVAHIEVNKTDNGLLEIENLCSLADKIGLVKPTRLQIQHLYLLTMKDKGRQSLESVHEKAKRVEAALAHSEFNILSHSFRLCYEIAVQYVHAEGFVEAGMWVKTLLATKSRKLGLLWIINGAILNVIINIELGDPEELFLALRRANYAIAKIKKDSAISQALTNLVKAHLNDPTIRSNSTRFFIDNYGQIDSEALEYKIIALSEVLSWAKRKSEKMKP